MSGQGFFDFRERIKQRVKPPPAPAATPTQVAPAPPLTVSQLASRIEIALKTQSLSSIAVQGEVSNFGVGSAGHFFFSLRDKDTCIDCTMWRSEAAAVKFQVKDGMEVVCRGSVGIHRQQSKYKVYVNKLEPVGQGALELAFQQLRQKLQREGLFEARRKKPIPSYPLRIAMITSAQAAALQDMLKVLGRFKFLRLMLYPTLVQGPDAAPKIAAAIEHLNRCHQQIGGADIILLGRGGGSLEDLWAFNEEIVARAVAASRIPIITGIGHEVDVTISDLVADHHAHTPTEAARVATRFWHEAEQLIDRQSTRLHRELRQTIGNAQQRLTAVQRHEIFRTPLARIQRLMQRIGEMGRQLASATDRRLAQTHRRLDQLQSRLQQQRTQIINRLREQIGDFRRHLATAMHNFLQRLRGRLQRNQVLMRDAHPKHRLNLSTQRLSQMDTRITRAISQDLLRRQQLVASMAARLEAINPQRVLQRGFSFTTLAPSGQVVRNSRELKAGDHLITHFAAGAANSVVESTEPAPEKS